MEMNTIIGIVIAVVIMLVGLIMILRKPKPVEQDRKYKIPKAF